MSCIKPRPKYITIPLTKRYSSFWTSDLEEYLEKITNNTVLNIDIGDATNSFTQETYIIRLWYTTSDILVKDNDITIDGYVMDEMGTYRDEFKRYIDLKEVFVGNVTKNSAALIDQPDIIYYMFGNDILNVLNKKTGYNKFYWDLPIIRKRILKAKIVKRCLEYFIVSLESVRDGTNPEKWIFIVY